MSVPFTAVVPAAGASSRFGSMKLLADVDGELLLQRTLRSLLEGGVSTVVLVVAPGHEFADVPLVRDSRVRLIPNPDSSRGMFSSVQVGLGVVESGLVLVLPADMPFVPPEVISAVHRACSETGDVVVPVHAGRRGHPIAIPARYRAGLVASPATSNLKAALLAVTGGPARELPVDVPGIFRDIDVPADLSPAPNTPRSPTVANGD